jgi:anti-sigma-K factor RskA
VTTQLRRTPDRAANVGKGWLWIPWFVALAFALLSALLFFANLRLKNDLLAIRASAQIQEAELRQSQALLEMLKSSTTIRASLHGDGSSGKAEGLGFYDPQSGNLIVFVSGLAPIPPEKTCEVWLLPQLGAPVPAGTFGPDDRGNATLIQKGLPTGMGINGFEVSVEQRAGVEAPTGLVIMRGSARK